jgi:hypothetical protein
MSLGGKVHNGVNTLSNEKVVDKICTPNVTFHKLEILRGLRGQQILQVGAIIQLVQHHDLVMWVVAHQSVGNMKCNESCYTSSQDVFGSVCGFPHYDDDLRFYKSA